MLHEPRGRGWQANPTSVPWRVSRAARHGRDHPEDVHARGTLGRLLLLTEGPET